jgi:hypothetical protein
MMDYKDMMKKERTITGYDLVKVFNVADSYCDYKGLAGFMRDREMVHVIVTSLMEDDVYDKLHQAAKESYERATDIDKVIKDIADVAKRFFGKSFPDKEET